MKRRLELRWLPQRVRPACEIYVPRSIVLVDAVPLLGTGKVDDVNLGRLASQLAKAS